VSAANRVRGGFGEADVADFALANEIGESADGFLDGSFGIDAVLVVQIDRVDAEALEAGVAGGANVSGRAVDAAKGCVGFVADDAEFCGEEDFISDTANGLADENFIVTVAVYVGGIEKGHAEIERAMDGSDRFGILTSAIEFGHAHATEAERGDEGAVFTEMTDLHMVRY